MADEEDSIDYKAENYKRLHRFLDGFNKTNSPNNVEIRAEDCFSSAIKFMELLEKFVDNPEEFNKLKLSWLRAIKDNDYKKFKKPFKKFQKNTDD